MLGLPFLGLKRVAGAVVGQADVSRRVSGRGMGLQSRKAVAPRFARVLQSAQINFCVGCARGFAPCSEAVARLDCQERASCCWTAALASFGCAQRAG